MGAVPSYLRGDACQAVTHKGQQRERDGLKARGEKNRTKSSYMKDKNEEDAKIKGEINQVKESDRGKRGK